MSVTSDTEIANLALTRLGNKSLITGLDQGTTTADLCNLHYPRCRDAVLRAHPWNFAVRRASLSQDDDYTSVFEYDYRFLLPTDCLKVIRTAWDSNAYATGVAVYGFPGVFGSATTLIPYRIEGRYLLCNETSAQIEYVAQITDVSQFDELFVDVLAQRLAAELSPAITANSSLTNQLWQVYQAKLVEARLVDAQEGTPRDVVDVSPWITARV